MAHLSFIQDLAVALAIAGVAAWVCQRVGISVVVGYLLAGIVIGPFTPPFSLVTDIESVHTLANLGLIFVMFFVGLELSLQRLRRLGAAAAAGTAITAVLLIVGSRLLGRPLGLTTTQSLFLAGVVVSSSSAVISKVLQEMDATRQPFGQLALGLTVLEDVVAVGMLALLGSVAATNAAAAPSVGGVLLRLAGFVLVVLVGAMLAVPRLLGKLRQGASAEVQTICVAGLVLGLSWLAAEAGYSIALGAFLIGSIVGGTPHKARIEQAFEGLRDIFAAVFFVSMGMLFDLRLVAEAWPMAVALTAFALVGRTLAASAGLTLVGLRTRDAMHAGLTILPLGEFSFVMAQLGVATKVMPPAFYPASVGAALVTTLLAPGIIRHSEGVARALDRREPEFLRAWREFSKRAIDGLRERREASLAKRLLSARLGQIAFEVALVLSAVLFSTVLYGQVEARLAPDSTFAAWLPLLYWAGFALVLLVPLVALWRNLGVFGMIVAEAAAGGPQARLPHTMLSHAVQFSGALVVLLLCMAVLPADAVRPAVLVPIIVVGTVLALLLRARLVRWHARMHVEMRHNLGKHQENEAALSTPGLADLPVSWSLRVHEHVLSDLSQAAGRSILDIALRTRFGCTIAGIGRQGVTLSNPGRDVVLFPNDCLLLVGTEEQIDRAEEWLGAPERAPHREPGFSELVSESLIVPDGFPPAGRTLGDLAVASRFGVLILGVEHAGALAQNPSGGHVIHPADSLLVLGTHAQNDAFRQSLRLGGETPKAA